MTQVGPPIPDDRLVNLAASEIDSSDKFSVESTAPDPLPLYIFNRCTKPVGNQLSNIYSLVLVLIKNYLAWTLHWIRPCVVTDLDEIAIVD